MKTITIILLTTLLAQTCKNNKQSPQPLAQTQETMSNSKAQDNTILEYESNSRSSFCKITFQNNELKVYKDRNNPEVSQTIPLSKDDLNAIKAFIQTYNPEDLQNLKAPTQKRLYDGASHANFKIKKGNQSYQTPGFDGGSPPQPIADIVNKIVSFLQN